MNGIDAAEALGRLAGIVGRSAYKRTPGATRIDTNMEFERLGLGTDDRQI